MQQHSIFIGVDVAKAELVISVHGQTQHQSIPNNIAGITSWLGTLAPQAHIAMESTGRYHGRLAHLARQAGFHVYVLNARDVYFYAKALGMRGKTDRLDCQVIARYLAEHHARLHEHSVGNAVTQQLNDLLNRRAKVTTHLSALRQVLLDLPELDSPRQSLLASFQTFLTQMDEQIEQLIHSDVQLREGCARLRTITGVGPQASALLGALFSRVAFTNSDALVAYCGLDPRPQDSGTKRGRRRLSKRGPALLRRQMWLVGFAASHSNALKPLYQSLRAKGLSTTAAIVVLARKLLRVAYAVWHTGKPFDLTLLGPAKS